MNLLQAFIYYVSYLWFPVVPVLILFLLRRSGPGSGSMAKGAAALFLAGITLAAWARFAEPRLLRVAEHDIKLCTEENTGSLRAAVVADMHIGVFGNALSAERIAARLESLSPDLVLMPGDFTYYPQTERLPSLFAPFAALDMPVYAVMGNHDEGLPGPDYTDDLAAVLQQDGIEILDPGEREFEKDGLRLAIIGTRDHWAALRDQTGEQRFKAEQLKVPVIMLQHNPDFIEEGARPGSFDLMVAGHTHGGQINLPWLTCHVTFACDIERYGYLAHPNGQLFVTSGTGMTGLPFRLNVPPVIDVLKLRLVPCEAGQ